jgi:hypothetical protein
MKRILLVSSSLLVLSTAGLLTVAHSEQDKEEQESREVRIGLAIAPTHLNLHGKDVRMVGLGSYIVNAQSACADCHSCPTYRVGHNPYLGQTKQLNADNYLAGGVPFGPITSPNITPDQNGNPAGLTEAEFLHAIHTGQDPDGSGRLLQVMPWPAFQNMTDTHLQAVYEYLRAIPHANAGSCASAGQ